VIQRLLAGGEENRFESVANVRRYLSRVHAVTVPLALVSSLLVTQLAKR
jgi:hypothetical protein